MKHSAIKCFSLEGALPTLRKYKKRRTVFSTCANTPQGPDPNWLLASE